MRRMMLNAAILCVLTEAGAAQQPSSSPTFEVASIRPTGDSRARQDADIQPSGRLVVTNTTLLNLIADFFEVQRHEMVSGDRLPAWVGSQRWDIVAQGPPVTNLAAQLPLYRRMMQNLLIERFKLVTRREMRDIPIYALVFARADRRLGPQMRLSSADCAALSAGALAISERPVVDETGLTGSFDFDLKWTPDDAAGPSGASLFTAIQEQLGLRLEPRHAPMNVFVIQSAERATPD
jgi:hypothetical protein